MKTSVSTQSLQASTFPKFSTLVRRNCVLAFLVAIFSGMATGRSATLADFPVDCSIDISPLGSVNQYARLHKPPNDMSGAPKPLVIYFHGLGDIGTDNTQQVLNSDINNLLTLTGSTSYILAPQLAASDWNGTVMSSVMICLAKVMTEYNVDWSRVYVTGLSLGGGATWSTLKNFPIYAAAIPISGVTPQGGGTMANCVGVPIWAFHNSGDPTVNVSLTRSRINDIRAAEGLPAVALPGSGTGVYTDGSHYFSGTDDPNVRYSEYNSTVHNAWTRAYGDNETGNIGMLKTWLMAKTRTSGLLQLNETVLVDFGNTALAGADSYGRGQDGSLRTWNCTMYSGVEKTVGMPIRPAFAKTSGGRQTQVVFKVSDAFGGYSALGPVDGTIYDGAISQDGWVTAANDPAAVTIYGLTPGAAYRLSFFASSTDNDGTKTRSTRFQLDAANYGDVNPLNNTDQQVVLTGTASASGTLVFQVLPVPGSGARYGLLTAVELKMLGAVDSTPPTVQILTPTDTDTYATSYPTISLTGNASDSVGVTSVTWTNGAASGTATGTGAWSIASVPLSAGTNIVTVTAHDAANNTASDTLSVFYTPNQAPIAQNDVATGSVNSVIDVDVLANDLDSDSGPQPLSVSSVGTPAHGVASIVNNKVRYVPATGFAGTDSVSYTITDGVAQSSATVYFTISPANVAPNAVDDNVTLNEEGSVDVDVLANDSDPDAGPQPISIVSVSTPSHGTASIVSGKVRYVPTAGYYGSDAVYYTITDGAAQSIAQVHFTVNKTSTADNLQAFGLGGIPVGTGASGSSRVLATGQWELTGQGAGLVGTSDAFFGQFLSVSGDFEVVVRVDDLQAGAGGTGRIGLVAREGTLGGDRMLGADLGAGLVPRSISRDTANQGATETLYSGTTVWSPSATWLKLARHGTTLTASVSADNVNYQSLGSVAISQLTPNLQVGLWVAGTETVATRGVVSGFQLSQAACQFAQSFDSWVTPGVWTDYKNATSPSVGQFNDISAEADGGQWDLLNSGTLPTKGRLRLVRIASSGTNSGAGFTRLTSGASVQKLAVSFKVSVAGINTNGDLAYLDLGSLSSLQDYSNATPSVGVANRLTIKGGGTNLYRFQLNGVNSANLAADGTEVLVQWYLNHSSTSTTYQAPDLSTATLAAGQGDLWVNGARIFTGAARNAAWTATTANSFRFRTPTSEPMTITFDDLVVGPLP